MRVRMCGAIGARRRGCSPWIKISLSVAILFVQVRLDNFRSWIPVAISPWIFDWSGWMARRSLLRLIVTIWALQGGRRLGSF